MEDLDFVLVPAGFLIMLAYHLCLLLKYNCGSNGTTSIGVEISDKTTLVDRLLKKDKTCQTTSGHPELTQANKKVAADEAQAKVNTGLSVISPNTTAAMSLASVSLALCTLIGSWIGTSTSEFVPVEMIYGNTSEVLISIKYLCVLISLLVAFSFFVQSARHFIHSNYLLGTPENPEDPCTRDADVENVKKCVKRGSIFWSLGLRSLYVALNFMLWFFGPIPMLTCSIVIVIALACHD